MKIGLFEDRTKLSVITHYVFFTFILAESALCSIKYSCSRNSDWNRTLQSPSLSSEISSYRKAIPVICYKYRTIPYHTRPKKLRSSHHGSYKPSFTNTCIINLKESWTIAGRALILQNSCNESNPWASLASQTLFHMHRCRWCRHRCS